MSNLGRYDVAMRRPTTIILCCISFLLGTLLGYYYIFTPNKVWLLFIAFAIIAAGIVSKKTRFIPLLCIAMLAGIALNTYHQNYKLEHGLSRSVYEKTEVAGTIKGDPYWDSERNYIFITSDLIINGERKFGDLKIKTFSATGKEGNKVLVKGKIYPIRAKPGYQISYANVDVISDHQPFLVQIKQLLYTGADRALDQNTAGFIKGILIGARSSMPQSAQDTLNSIGLSHVVAVSGYNLTILVVLLQRILRKKWLWGSLVLSLGLVWTFTLLTGGSASIVRAAIMATAFLVASYYGRPLSIFTCISLTAAITLLVNPAAAIEDIGWQLSFLSLTGIVILTPIIQKVLPKKTKLLSELMAVTLAAQIATIPYILYLFGNYSLLALLANFIVMPIIPILMLVGFVAALAGIFIPNYAYLLGQPINWAVGELFKFLTYLQLQQGFVVNTKPQITTLVVWYLCLSLLGVIVYHRRLTPSSLTFQTPDQLVK